MSDWSQDVAAATSAAEHSQAAETRAELRFDEVHAQAQAAGDVAQARSTTEFRDWLAARKATDTAWGQWAMVMDSKPHG